MPRTLLGVLMSVLAAAALAGCGGGDDGDPSQAPTGTPPAAVGTVSVDAYCQGFQADLGPVADAYNSALQAVNEAHHAGAAQGGAAAVTDLQDSAAEVAALFRAGVGTVADAELSAALSRAANELDSHVAAVADLDLDDYGDPELTPDGSAFREAADDVLARCE